MNQFTSEQFLLKKQALGYISVDDGGIYLFFCSRQAELNISDNQSTASIGKSQFM